MRFLLKTAIVGAVAAAGTLLIRSLLPSPPPHLPPLIRSDSFQLPAPQSKVTIVEFVDYQCEACATTHKSIQKLLKKYPGQITYAVRHYPLEDQHPNAFLAAEAVEAAATQNKFWEMHTALLDEQSRWASQDNPTNYFLDIATEIGLTTFDFTAALKNHFHAEKINQDIKDTQALKLTGVPTIFINGANHGYIQTYEEFDTQVSQAMATSDQTSSPQPENTITDQDLKDQLYWVKSSLEEKLERINEDNPYVILIVFILLLLGGWRAYDALVPWAEEQEEYKRSHRKKAISDYQKQVNRLAREQARRKK